MRNRNNPQLSLSNASTSENLTKNTFTAQQPDLNLNRISERSADHRKKTAAIAKVNL